MAGRSYDGASAVHGGAQPEGSADVGATGRDTGRGPGAWIEFRDRKWTLDIPSPSLALDNLSWEIMVHFFEKTLNLPLAIAVPMRVKQE